jgi:hypothetical protein
MKVQSHVVVETGERRGIGWGTHHSTRFQLPPLFDPLLQRPEDTTRAHAGMGFQRKALLRERLDHAQGTHHLAVRQAKCVLSCSLGNIPEVERYHGALRSNPEPGTKSNSYCEIENRYSQMTFCEYPEWRLREKALKGLNDANAVLHIRPPFLLLPCSVICEDGSSFVEGEARPFQMQNTG